MRKLSMKAKLILWYTFFFTLILILNLILLYLFAEPLLYDSAQDSIKMTTETMVDRIVLIEGDLYYKDNESQLFNYYEDGIAFVLYNNGNFYDGQYPYNVDENININPYIIQRYSTAEATWLIYDVPFQEGYTLRAFYNYSNVTDAYLRLTNTLLILSPFLILIISLGGYFIVKKALSPLQTIIDSSARIKRQNDYSIRIETLKQQDELSNVILVLNDLLDKFEQTIKREQQFSANVSHELRTPVAVLKAQIEYIQSLKDPNDINQELAELNGEISQLERLVNQLLELSRSKHIRTLTYAELDIRLALNTLIKSYDKEINALNLRLNLDLNVDNTPFITEPTLFNRIMSNLLSNAIKYNKVNGFVEIIVTEHEAMYQIDVKDSGVGIDHLDLDNIFNPFYQTDPSRSSQHLSLGIGLTLTKELIEVLKGTITVKSTLNKGSTFTVTLPKIQSI